MKSIANIRTTRPARGFTLVELMIAMALVGVLTAAIYAVFVNTADSLRDVDGMTSAMDEARFGIAQVRKDLQQAGSQATPNAEEDPWVLGTQETGSSALVQGIMGYEEWQNTDLSTLLNLHGEDPNLFGDNPGSAFSGFVVIGAYDVPANFFVQFGDDGIENDVVYVPDSDRGRDRLIYYDPFDLADTTGQQPVGGLDDRLLRVTDSGGYSQIMEIEDDSDNGRIELDINGNHIYLRDGDEPMGFERTVESDVNFDAALLDAYWYHVRPSPENPRNLQLVRQRLDAGDLIDDDADGLAFDDLANPNGLVVDDEPDLVLANNVVDFRVWFDCAGGADPLQGAGWQDRWDVQTDGCIGDDPASSQAQRARVAHVRLSTRTESENPNQPHLTVANDEGFQTDDGQMRTFEVYEDAEGAASVVTVQSTVELANFSQRHIN